LKGSLLVVFICLVSSCATQRGDATFVDPSIVDKDAELTSLYNTFKDNRHDYGSSYGEGDGEGREVLLNNFTDTLLQTLADPNYAKADFDVLANAITVVSSDDKQLKLFSWDEFSGGTWHIYRAAFQYATDANLISGLLPVDEFNYAEAIHFKVVDKIDEAYLIKAYGTHGSGQDYYLYRLLSINGNSLTDCDQCFNGSDLFIFEKMRGFKAEPSYNAATRTISYPELAPAFKDGEDTGFTRPTGKTLSLVYLNGRFLRPAH